MNWSLDEIQARLQEIKNKGFLGIPPGMFRSDEGIIGQLLEREFSIQENNLSVGDLGEFELKSMRKKSGKLTLCHKKPDTGLTPIEIFNRFGYIKPSNRDTSIIKKKLFTTITGLKKNSLNLILYPSSEFEIAMYFSDEFICSWNLFESLNKISQIILVFAENRGEINSRNETFHFNEAFLLSNLKSISDLVTNGSIVIEFCIDQVLDSSRGPHDRGPHIRMPKRKLFSSFHNILTLLSP